MRYELKYAVEHLEHHAIIAQIRNHPSSFSTLYPDRQVNNYYFDDPDFTCFHQNVEGHPKRKKLRLRWYGDTKLPTLQSILEIKHKDRELGYKVTHPINADIADAASLRQSIAHINDYQPALSPVLKNTYIRSYFLSQDGKFRVTVDRYQTFSIPFSKMSSLATDQLPVIVELKFEAEDFPYSDDVTTYLPFRQTKNSKYANGIELLYL